MKKKKKKNNYLLIIIISVICILLFAIAGVIVLSKRIKNNSKEKENTNEVYEEQEVEDLLYNNFLLTYLLEADVGTGEGTLTIDGEEGIYYAVTDYILDGITSLEDIDRLFENTLDEPALIRAKKFMLSNYGNQYVDNEGTLYVKKGLGNCVVNKGEPVDRSKISTLYNDDKTYAVYNDKPYELYPDDNKKLKAASLWFNCAPNITQTGLGADDVYDPNYVETEEN